VTIEQLNNLTGEEARAGFLRCCGSSRWAKQMVERRPFKGTPDLFAAAEDIWEALSAFDWIEAFSHQHRIGEPESGRKKSAKDGETGERAGIQGAPQEIIKQLADGDQQYEKKFRFIFVISAAGKSATQVLAQLQERLNNDVATELKIAAGEQNKINRLRLQKLLQN
jgi:2-oxo-4-hydroxy-4-carboxy-5-ureidoimidazoline decarboxylase